MRAGRGPRALARLAAGLVVTCVAVAVWPVSQASAALTLTLSCPAAAVDFGNRPSNGDYVSGSDCDATFGSTTSTSTLRVYQADGAGTALTGPGAVADYAS